MKSRVHVLLQGRVQAVCFRGQAERWALESGLRGWVRNRISGGGEVVAEGERDALESLVELLRKGPPLARVDSADVRWLEFRGEFDSFRIRRTEG